MNTASHINRLRAQFLWECPEKDQMRRIVKPYTMDSNELPKINQEKYYDLDSNIKKFYIAPDGTDMLEQLESPPICDSYMDNYRHINRAERNKLESGEESSEKVTQISDADQLEFREQEAKFGNVDPIEPTTIKNDNKTWDVANKTASDDDLHTLNGLGNTNAINFNGSNFTVDSSDSESSDVKRKTSRRLPFSRIFKGKRDSDETQKKIGSKGKSNPHSRNNKHIAFDMKFDYDRNLADDDDDDDDEDDDGEDLKSEFFQLDTEQSKSHNQNSISEKENHNNLGTSSNSLLTMHTNGNSYSNNTNNGGNNHNTNRRKTHFPQNIIPRNPLSDNIRANSLKSERLTKGSNHDDSLSNTSKKKTSTQDEYISDMESLINENDLDKLDLDNVPSNIDKSSSLKQLESIESDEKSPTNNEQIVLTEDDDSDSISSYGRSLLDSDFSTENGLNKDDTSALESASALDDSDIMPETISHSIPKTLEDYGIYHGQDDSTIDDAFDYAVQDIKNSDRASISKERRTTNQLIPHSLLNRRLSSNSNTGLKMKTHTRSSSNTSCNNIRGKTDYNKIQNPTHHIIQTEQTTSSHTSSPQANTLVIQKVTNFEKPKTNGSQLSSLFNKKKQVSGDLTEALEYFSFVSGDKVPQYEAEDLNIYIQPSEKYKHKSLKLNVRKSATIFEVIGYILYMYSKELKEKNTHDGALSSVMIQNPNKFCLKIVDEDGEPFEDNFGKLDRAKQIKQLSDDEVVLCLVDDKELALNNKETPLPYNQLDERPARRQSAKSGEDLQYSGINQLSYYRPILGNEKMLDKGDNAKVIDIKVFLYPCTNKAFNFTSIRVSVTSSINDILVKYCKMKNLDPNDYILKVTDKKIAYNLNDTVLRLDGNDEVELISKREARKIKVQKAMPDIAKPTLPTIQSNDLTPLTLEPLNTYLQAGQNEKTSNTVKDSKPQNKLKKLGPKHRLGLTTQISGSSNISGSGSTSGGFFKNKNSSKSSLHGSLQYYTPNRSSLNVNGNGAGNYQDLFSGAYHKYKVWRRQQMSLMTKHERTLALDGDYIYIVPPEKQLHWHDNVKTKSIHISQVILIRKSKRVPEYFKLFFKKSQHEIKRYYLEAVSPEECDEIVSRIQNSVSAYRMNHK